MNADELAAAFAEQGIVCGTLLLHPHRDAELDMVVRTARNADAVVLDWEFDGDGGDTCVKIIRRLSESARGRRVVVIYTGTDALGELEQKLGELARMDPTHGRCWLSNGLRIVVVRKKRDVEEPNANDEGFASARETELPAKLLEIFAQQTDGILTRAALRAVGEVRDASHQLLEWFHPGHDDAFRYQASGEDGAEAADDMVATIRDAIGDLLADPSNDIAERIRGEVPPPPEPRTSEKPPRKTITAPPEHLEFATLVYGEQFSHSRTARAETLSLGVVVQTCGPDADASTRDYFVCLLPVCDAQRAHKGEEHLMVPFVRAEWFGDELTGEERSEGRFAIKDGEKVVCLEVTATPQWTRDLTVFRISTAAAQYRAGGSPIAADAGRWDTIEGPSLRYVGRLRPLIAQRLAATFSTAVGRVGIPSSKFLHDPKKALKFLRDSKQS